MNKAWKRIIYIILGVIILGILIFIPIMVKLFNLYSIEDKEFDFLLVYVPIALSAFCGFYTWCKKQIKKPKKSKEIDIIPKNKKFNISKKDEKVEIIDTTMKYSNAKERLDQKVSFKIDILNVGNEYISDIKVSTLPVWDLFKKYSIPFTQCPIMNKYQYEGYFSNKKPQLIQVIKNGESIQLTSELMHFKHIMKHIFNSIYRSGTFSDIPIGKLKFECSKGAVEYICYATIKVHHIANSSGHSVSLGFIKIKA